MEFRAKSFLVVLSMATLMAVAGCGGNQAKGGGGGAAIAGDAVQGKEIFMGTCVSCHGQDAKGLPGLGKSLVTKSDWMKKQSDEALLAFLKTGRTASDPENTTKVDMPPKGGNPALTEDDLKNLVTYVRSIQK